MASILKSKAVTGGISGIIDAGIGMALGFVAGLFSGKTKKAIASMQTQADAMLINEQRQSQTLKMVMIGLGVVAALVIFFFVLRKKR